MSDACPQCGKSSFAPNDDEWAKKHRRVCFNCSYELRPAKKTDWGPSGISLSDITQQPVPEAWAREKPAAKPVAKPVAKPKELDWTEYNRQKEATVQCPTCMSTGIHPKATRCPHCTSELDLEAAQLRAANADLAKLFRNSAISCTIIYVLYKLGLLPIN